MELIIIVLFLLVAATTSLICKYRIIIEVITVFATFMVFIFSTIVAYKVAYFGVYRTFSFLTVDELAATVLFIIGFVGLATSVYSVPYLRQETHKQIINFNKVKQYFALFNVFLAVMILTVAASSPIFTWIAIEATTLSGTFLISFYNKTTSTEAAWKYLIINSIGLLLGFFGTLLYFTEMQMVPEIGIATWSDLLNNATNLNPLVAKIAFVFTLIGYGTKAGLAPMHTWLPDAHGKAPAPISALLSGVLLNVAFISILRFKMITDVAIGCAISQKLLILFGLFSIVVSAMVIFTQKNYKRLLAYSSIENMGIISIGFGLGGLGAFAGLMHMLLHALIKSALFLMAGTIFLRYSSTYIANIRGLCSALPITSVLFFTGVLAITGMPPFGMFLTKLYIFTEGMQVNIIVTCIVMLFVVVLFVGFFKHLSRMFFGVKPTNIEKGETNIWLVISPLLLIVVALIFSFSLPPFLQLLINKAVVGR